MHEQYVALGIFVVAVIHTFLVSRFRALAHRYPEGSVGENLFHLLGETEAVFIVWSGVLFAWIAVSTEWHTAIHYIEGLDYTEPKFVFVIMTIAATRPIVELVERIIRLAALLLPLPGAAAFLVAALMLGPLLGSFVTEPAAMTVTAMVLKRQFFDRPISRRFKYMLIGALFVHVSIGGTLTNFAAPPVLMVAKTWGWSTQHMLVHFGWKAIIACAISTTVLVAGNWQTLATLPVLAKEELKGKLPVVWWMMALHVGFLAFTVMHSHHSDIFFGGFAFFLGCVTVTKEYQEPLKLRESFLVGGFLAGLVTLGGLQKWWLQPLLGSLGEAPLYLGATGLTAVTDNAALTFLGSQVEGLSETMRYFLVAGSVVGGGLTVIANAPNPAGYAILNDSFSNGGGQEGISPLGLLLGALPPTLIALVAFWLLP